MAYKLTNTILLLFCQRHYSSELIVARTAVSAVVYICILVERYAALGSAALGSAGSGPDNLCTDSCSYSVYFLHSSPVYGRQ